MCVQKGELGDEGKSEAMLKLVLGEPCQTYYKAFRRLKKMKAGLDSYYTEAAQNLASRLPIAPGRAALADTVEKHKSVIGELSDTMGCLLATQVLFRDLQPGEVRVGLVTQCRFDMSSHTPPMNVPAPLALAMSALAPTTGGNCDSMDAASSTCGGNTQW